MFIRPPHPRPSQRGGFHTTRLRSLANAVERCDFDAHVCEEDTPFTIIVDAHVCEEDTPFTIIVDALILMPRLSPCDPLATKCTPPP